MENPLDLLSRAATFIHDQMKSANSKEESLRRSPPSQSSYESEVLAAGQRDFVAKELPTKSRKDRRKKEIQQHVVPKSKHLHRREIQVLQEESDAPLDMTTGRRDLHFDFTSKPPSYAQSIGMCDPVIDEHFRRSLGERYSHLFGSSTSTEEENNCGLASPASNDAKSPTVSVTGFSVDDHFAKALGETWLKLQNDEGKEKEKSDSKPGSPLTAKQRHELVIT